MAGGRRGLVAPQNTFLENIVRRSNGKNCLWISVTQAGFDFFFFLYECGDCRRLPPGADRCGGIPELHSPASPARGPGRWAGLEGVCCTPSLEERSLGDAFGAFSRAYPLSSPGKPGIW